MEEPTTRSEEAAGSPLLTCLQELLVAFRPAFRQERPYRRCVALVLGSVFAFARHTLSQVLLTLGVTEQDWSGWYRLFSRPRIDVDALAARLQDEGAKSFVNSWNDLMGVIASKSAALEMAS